MATPYDEVLVALLKLLPSVADVAVCNNRVYHLEVFQNLPSEAQYPCIVYWLNDDFPEKELSGNSNFYHAIYTIVVSSKKSADIRQVAAEIKTLSYEDTNDQTFAQYPNVEWVEIDDDTEDNEFAVEQQDKGFKTASLTAVVDHWGAL